MHTTDELLAPTLQTLGSVPKLEIQDVTGIDILQRAMRTLRHCFQITREPGPNGFKLEEEHSG
jgi:hypothetical protein